MFMESVDSSRSVTFRWSAPLVEEQNGVIISYTLNITEAGSGQITQRTVPSSQTSVTISSLLPFTTYFCSIAASTSVNRGPFSPTLTVNTPEESKELSLPSITHSLIPYSVFLSLPRSKLTPSFSHSPFCSLPLFSPSSPFITFRSKHVSI